MKVEPACRDPIDGTLHRAHQLDPLGSLRPALRAQIRTEHPALADPDLIAHATANRCRSLSTLAAVPAPIIMMSRSRQESRDRMRARPDHQENPKAELGIRLLHERIDRLIAREWQRLEEARAVQLEMLDGSKDPSP